MLPRRVRSCPTMWCRGPKDGLPDRGREQVGTTAGYLSGAGLSPRARGAGFHIDSGRLGSGTIPRVPGEQFSAVRRRCDVAGIPLVHRLLEHTTVVVDHQQELRHVNSLFFAAPSLAHSPYERSRRGVLYIAGKKLRGTFRRVRSKTWAVRPSSIRRASSGRRPRNRLRVIVGCGQVPSAPAESRGPDDRSALQPAAHLRSADGKRQAT